MKNNFSAKIKDIESRINQLKTHGLMSSSSLGAVEKDVTTSFQIVATASSGGTVTKCASSQTAYVRISTVDGKPALVCMYISSPTDFGKRTLNNYRTTENLGDYQYCYSIDLTGDENDLAALNRGETLPWTNYTFRFVATSNFNFDIYYENN